MAIEHGDPSPDQILFAQSKAEQAVIRDTCLFSNQFIGVLLSEDSRDIFDTKVCNTKLLDGQRRRALGLFPFNDKNDY